MNLQYSVRLNIFHWVLFSLLLVEVFFIQHAFARSESKRGITIEDLSAIQDIRTMVLSPDGKYVAFQTIEANKDVNSHKLNWYVVATTSESVVLKVAEATTSTVATHSMGIKIGEIASSEIVWSLDSEWIYFTRKNKGETQIWRSNRNRFGLEQVTYNGGEVHDLKNYPLKYDPAGSKIFFTVGRNHADTKRLLKEEAKQGYLQAEPPSYSITDGPILPVCKDDRDRAAKEMYATERECRLTVWIYDTKSNVERKATKAETAIFYAQEDSRQAQYRQGNRRGENSHIKFLSENGDRQAWIENENPDVYKGILPPMVVTISEKGKEQRCPAKECRSKYIRGLWWYLKGKELVFQVNDGRGNSISSFYGWKPGERNVRTIIRSDDRFSQCESSGSRLICGRETWTSPKKIISMGLRDGKIFTITNVNPNFEDFSFTKIEKVFGKDNNGKLVYAHLVYPRNYNIGQKYPLVITQYVSGGFLRGGVGDEHPIHVYAQNGMAVLSFHHRTSDDIRYEKEGDPIETAVASYYNTYIRQDPATAIENMVANLVDRGIVDPRRVGISGFSFGSMVLSTALLRKNYAAASTATISTPSPNSTFRSSSFTGKVHDRIFNGPPFSPKGHEMRHKYSFEANAEKIDTPLLLQIADREVFYSIHNYNALKNNTKPAEMYIYPDEYHVKWQSAHKYMVYRRNLDWFNFWLRDVEDPAPEKAEQYKRWRELRELHKANLKKTAE